MRRSGSQFVRSLAFFRKELVEVLRQPRLILTLVMGPFLILLLFGVGYRSEARAVRTLFVVYPGSELEKQVDQYAPTISPQLIYAGKTADEGAAKQALARHEVDVVIVTPKDAYQTISNDKQAVFTLFHNEIDPAQVGYIEYLGQLYVEEVNKRVVSSIVAEGQQEASDVQGDITAARANAAAIKTALQAGDATTARSEQSQMRTRVDAIALAVGASAGLLEGVQNNVEPQATQQQSSVKNDIRDLQKDPSVVSDIPENQSSYDQQIADIDRTDQKLANLQSRLTQFQKISPSVMVSPFRSETFGITRIILTPTDFFTPGVIVLLLQHITITVSALSIVRERRSGTLELFRVSPISSGQVLFGKYLSYMVMGAIIAAVLALLLAFGLKMPMLGSWWQFAAVCLGLIYAALGIGFFISLVAETDSQAVQFAMIALLLSVFFSGFLLDLRYLWAPVRAISWALPATHATLLLQNIMLRGNNIIWYYLAAMVGIGLFLMVISWLLLRGRMKNELRD